MIIVSRPLIILFSLFAALFLVINFLVPQYRNLKELQSKIEEKKIELQMEKEYSSRLEKIAEELKKYEENLAKIDSALPPEPSLPSLFNFLQEEASEAGLVLERIFPPFTNSIKEELVKKGWDPELKETKVHFTVSGFYPSFKNFLSSLEKSARLMGVESVSFSTTGQKEPIDFYLKIKTYSY